MSKIERLNARVAKLLTVAVHEVLEVVRETVSEYQEKTARTQRENESLRRRLQELQDKVKRVSPGNEQSAAPLISGERASFEQEWNPGLGQDTELILTEEKQELTEEHIIGQREEEGSGLESDHMADSEIDCDILVSGNSTLGSEGISPKTDAALLVYTSHPVISNTDMDSIHAVNITNSHSPKTTNFGILPSLGSDEIKTEPDSLEYTTSQQSSQNNFYECAESRSNMAQTDCIQELEQIDTESYGLAYFNSNTTFGERFAFGKNRSVVDSRHKQYYGKEEQHRCVLCGKTFSRVGNLRIHQRCHTGEKPYCCMQCGRRFSHAGNLKKHKRVHTGERPYCCHQCGKTFSQSSHLKKHQKIHIVRHFSVA